MSVTFDKSAYLRRLALSFGVVSISTLPLLRSDVASGLVSPWCWLFLLHDFCHILPSFHIPPVAFVVVTLLALAVAALRVAASAVVTLWFVINALGMWVLLATFQLEPAG